MFLPPGDAPDTYEYLLCTINAHVRSRCTVAEYFVRVEKKVHNILNYIRTSVT